MLNLHAKKLGNIAVLGLQGQIVNGQTEILRNTVQAMAGVNAVKLDLAGVTTVDASGLGMMLALREQLESRGIRFELMNVNKRVGMVLALTRLDSVFRITSGLEFPAVPRIRKAPVAALASCA